MNDLHTLDLRFLREAIKQSQKSVEAGCFSAGEAVVENGQVLSRGISDVILKFHELRPGELNNHYVHWGCKHTTTSKPYQSADKASGWANIRQRSGPNQVDKIKRTPARRSYALKFI